MIDNPCKKTAEKEKTLSRDKLDSGFFFCGFGVKCRKCLKIGVFLTLLSKKQDYYHY